MSILVVPSVDGTQVGSMKVTVDNADWCLALVGFGLGIILAPTVTIVPRKPRWKREPSP